MDESFDITQDKFYNKALRFLSFRPRSEKEVRDNLKRFKIKNKKTATAETQKKTEAQNFSGSENFSDSVVARKASVIDKVIDKLKEKNFINDEEFAKWWIEQRTTFRPRGQRLIKIELRQKGISRDLIDEIIQNSEFIVGNEKETVRKLIEKKLPKYKSLPKEKIYEKLMRFLASKGFDFETIKDVLYEKLK